jgi:uncharacterized protein YoxC
MESVLIVVEIIALAAVAVLCSYLVTVLVRVRNILTVVEHDVRELSAKAIPVMENLEVITEKVKNITETIDEQVDVVKNAVNSVKDIADNLVDFERRVQAKIEEPVMETVGTFAAIFKGVQAFMSRIKA